ncbi:hypothetical protein E2C01_016087 [Portunus trituberculatus]|uniref:Uncharacterized protein n=1 Tax=Portunus trituberculatus TaxID=210409 RepID=A0A5B7DNI5_PORTR|nr:hypothetical protein [Portunus trituberculatus]
MTGKWSDISEWSIYLFTTCVRDLSVSSPCPGIDLSISFERGEPGCLASRHVPPPSQLAPAGHTVTATRIRKVTALLVIMMRSFSVILFSMTWSRKATSWRVPEAPLVRKRKSDACLRKEQRMKNEKQEQERGKTNSSSKEREKSSKKEWMKEEEKENEEKENN